MMSLAHLYKCTGSVVAGSAVALPPLALAAASKLAKCLSFYVTVFYVMGNSLTG